MPPQDQSGARPPRITSTRQQRLTKGLVESLTAPPRRQPPQLKREEPRGGIPGRRGYSETNLQPGTGTQTGGGIASPLIEGDQPGTGPVEDRTHHPVQRVYTSDGLFFWDIQALASIKFTDANGGIAEMQFAQPSDPEP